MLYTAAFDIVKANADTAFGTLTLASSGSTDIVLTIGSVTGTDNNGTTGATTFWIWEDYSTSNPSAGRVFCQDQSPYAQTRYAHFSRTAWPGAVTIALRALATTAGDWGSKNPTCTFNTTTGVYTFSVSSGTISTTWSSAAGRRLFGFSGNGSAAASHTGTRVPLFVVSPTLSYVSDPTPNYEPRGIGNHVTSENGQGFGLARYVSPLYRDWTQQFETYEKTMRLGASQSGTHPWTIQALFEHCRGRLPFLVGDGGFIDPETEPAVFTFREEGIAFQPVPHTPGNFAQMYTPFKCVVQGFLMEEAV